MKKMFSAVFGLLAAGTLALGQGYLSSDTYVVTTNSASQTIVITNWPSGGSSQFEWYPSAILLNNRGGTTGELLRVEHIRTGITNIMVTNTAISVTNQLYVLNSASAISTNWIPGARWYVVPATDKLHITTACTNAEIIVQREVSR